MDQPLIGCHQQWDEVSAGFRFEFRLALLGLE
jgi:hypothetical protein